jgi:hypothetical protein
MNPCITSQRKKMNGDQILVGDDIGLTISSATSKNTLDSQRNLRTLRVQP